jgi:hypothetical protein
MTSERRAAALLLINDLVLLAGVDQGGGGEADDTSATGNGAREIEQQVVAKCRGDSDGLSHCVGRSMYTAMGWRTRTGCPMWS